MFNATTIHKHSVHIYHFHKTRGCHNYRDRNVRKRQGETTSCCCWLYNHKRMKHLRIASVGCSTKRRLLQSTPLLCNQPMVNTCSSPEQQQQDRQSSNTRRLNNRRITALSSSIISDTRRFAAVCDGRWKRQQQLVLFLDLLTNNKAPWHGHYYQQSSPASLRLWSCEASTMQPRDRKVVWDWLCNRSHFLFWFGRFYSKNAKWGFP